VLWRVTEIVDEISSSEYAIDHRLSRLRWKLEQFEKLAEEKGVSKMSLLNEAVADLLRKYMQK
jgi:hypothetical protein